MEVFRCIYEIILSEFVAFDFNEIGVVGGKKRGVGVEMDGFDTPKTLQTTPYGGVGWGSGVGRKRKGKADNVMGGGVYPPPFNFLRISVLYVGFVVFIVSRFIIFMQK